MVFKLALRNIFRQKVRTAMTLTAILFGVSSLVLSGGFIQDIFVQLGEAIIHSQTGHVQVFKKDFLDRGTRQPERFLIDNPQTLSDRIAGLPGVKRVSARLSFSGLLNNGKRDLGIVGEGIEPSKEAELGTFVSMTAGRQLADDDSFGMVVGQGVAHSLSLQVGDRVTMVMNTSEGALNTLDFEIIGIFQSFSKDYDARAVRIPLPAAQELMASDGANLLVVNLQRTEDTDAIQTAVQMMLNGELEARNWKQLSDFYEKTLQLYDRQFSILQLIILLMVLLSVTNAVNMTAFERMGEFGTLQAIGNTHSQVFRLIVLENALLGLIGASAGILIGVLLALTISAIGIPMPPPPNANVGYTAFIRIDLPTIVGAFAIGLMATSIAAVIPAMRVSRTQIVDALRQNN